MEFADWKPLTPHLASFAGQTTFFPQCESIFKMGSTIDSCIEERKFSLKNQRERSVIIVFPIFYFLVYKKKNGSYFLWSKKIIII